MITSNPTKTITILKGWASEIGRRWRSFAGSVLGRLRRDNGSRADSVSNDPFVMLPGQQRQYMEFLNSEIDRLLLVTPEAPNWQANHQLNAYKRALNDTRARLISQGARIVPTPAETLAARGIQAFTARPTLGDVAALSPIHRESLEFLFSRSYDTLKGWTGKMSTEVRTILFDAIAQGRGVRDVARDIEKRIGVSRSRALTIARTEINQANARAVINESVRIGQELGVEILIRWVTAIVPTAKGNPVRPAHARVHGVVMTSLRALNIKATDGVNCRCALRPVLPGEAEEVAVGFTAERNRILRAQEEGRASAS